MGVIYRFFIVDDGVILDELATLDEAEEWRKGIWADSHPESFILEVRSNLARPVGAMGVGG